MSLVAALPDEVMDQKVGVTDTVILAWLTAIDQVSGLTEAIEKAHRVYERTHT